MTQFPGNPIILVDGSSYLYRAYHAFPSLTNRAGEPTGAMYGVLNMLRKLILQYQPTHAAVVFDKKGKTFRDELFKYYKAHRPQMPNDLQAQIDPLYAIIRAMGLPLIMISGVEADDVIGTLAREAEKTGHSVIISTCDKDMAQLVTPNITLMNTMTNTFFGPQEIEIKYGVPPELIIDFLALIGDSSDNIPGVPGVGKKTAQALLRGIGGLDALYAQIDKITQLSFRGAKTLATKLEQHKDIVYLAYQLATIKTDVKLDVTCEKLIIENPAIDKLFNLFKKYEFKNWNAYVEINKRIQVKKKLMLLNAHKNKKKEVFTLSLNNYKAIFEESQLTIWIEKLKKTSVFAFDIETDSLNSLSANLIGLSFAITTDMVIYVPMAHDYPDIPDQISRVQALKLLKPLLEDDGILKVGRNLKFNHSILQNYGIELRGIAFDTILESYILDSRTKHYVMDFFSVQLLKQKTFSIKNIADKSKKQLPLNHGTAEDSGRYIAEHTNIILQLHSKMWPQLQQHKGLLNIFQHIEMPLIPVLSRIERNGVKIDPVVLYKHSQEIAIRLTELEQKAYDITGECFNLASTKQLQTILFEKYGIKPLKKTPGGVPSTSEKVLEDLALVYPLPKIILEYRSLAKLKSTYIDKLPMMINQKTGRVHTSYHQAVTVTGRLSSTDPNLQNIPIRNKEGRRIRQAFIAPENHVIVSADYSQIELRIMAHLSHDKGLLTAFEKGRDIHRATAAELFGLSLDSVTNEQRRSAKAINFGLIYGMSAFGLSRQLNIPLKKSQRYINLYFERYPGVQEYIERTKIKAKQKGYVETVDGRRLYLPNITTTNTALCASAERAAINAPMQGTAADIIKRAMISVDARLAKERLRVKMIMQVHDELVFEVHKDDVEFVSNTIHEVMENTITLDVPLRVQIGSGDNWDQAH